MLRHIEHIGGKQMIRYSLHVVVPLALAISALPLPAKASGEQPDELVSPGSWDPSSSKTDPLSAMGRYMPIQIAQGGAGGDGDLYVRPSGPSVCPSGNVYFEGQTVDLFGSGFSPGAAIDIYYGVNDQNVALIATATANSSGTLDTSVVIPTGPSTPAMGAMEARGQMSDGGRLYLNTLLQIAGSPGPDSDGDLVPDICDNCPNTPNSDQENNDRDELGNACDPCPLDAANDADGDGLCSDVDVCPFDPNNDTDGDGRCGNEDNCPTVANPTQLDQDRNGIGDACQATPTCSDGIDNDRDGLIDFPADSGCSDANDTTETDPNLPCDDGVDNDSDARIDYRSGKGDRGCSVDTSLPEDPECDDGIDNDGDGKVDWDGDFNLHTPDPDCGGVGSHPTELPEPGLTGGIVSGVLLLSVLRRDRTPRQPADAGLDETERS